MSRILFIGHDGNRSGAPLVLLYYLQWLAAKNPDRRPDLLLLRGGELEAEYRKVAEVFVLPANDDNPTLWQRGINRLKKKAKIGSGILRRAPFNRSYDAVFGNTIISLEYLKFFKQKGSPAICWLHELEYVVNLFSVPRFVELSAYPDCFAIGSKAVENMLRKFGIETKTRLVYDFSKVDTSIGGAEIGRTVRSELGIPANAFIVGGSGTIEWRKGTDWFLQIASQMIARNGDFYFVWLGGKSPVSEVQRVQLQHDFERFNLEKRLIFADALSDPRRIFAALDVFALTSREDTFPLVCLEAASLGKPIICFENAGGMPEFVETDAGAIVAYGDINAFCEKILYFYNYRDKLFQAGETAREKANTKFSAEESCQRIDALLAEFTN